MAFDFPDSPLVNDIVTSPDGSATYYWDGTKWLLDVAGGAYVPLDGSLPMTGGLEVNDGGITISITTTSLSGLTFAAGGTYPSINVGDPSGADLGTMFFNTAHLAGPSWEFRNSAGKAH